MTRPLLALILALCCAALAAPGCEFEARVGEAGVDPLGPSLPAPSGCLTLSPAVIDLGSVAPGADGQAAVTLHNGCTEPVEIARVVVDGDDGFSLLLDASGSMVWAPERTRGGLGMASLFIDVFERLEFPYCLDAYHNNYIPLNGFEEALKGVDERDQFLAHVIQNYWGQGGTNIRDGIRGVLERIEEARKNDDPGEHRMEFVFVLTDGDENYEEAMSEADMGELMEGYGRFSEEIAAAGVLESSDRLRPVQSATSVRVRSGKATITDGPFAETKEALGGFYLINVPSLDEATAWAEKIPSVAYGTVEVRPIWEME